MKKFTDFKEVALENAIEGVCLAVAHDCTPPTVSISDDQIKVVRHNSRCVGYTDKQIKSIYKGLLMILGCCFNIEYITDGFKVTFGMFTK